MRPSLALSVLLLACGNGSDSPGGDDGVDAAPPGPTGCIDDTSTGDHKYTCSELAVDVRVPAACQAPGCGLILELHGDTGNGLLMDQHTNLRALGAERGYIVAAPTGPYIRQGMTGSTWHEQNDAALIDIVTQLSTAFHVDANKVHVTGFSRGAFVTWRLLCDHADLFASAAPGGGGTGTGFGERTCFDGKQPSRKLPILFLMGRTDASVGYDTLTDMRDNAIATYGLTGPETVTGDTAYKHDRWSGNGTVIETFDHAYETVGDGPWASAKGHCIPGSKMDPYNFQYAIPCVLPNAFTWGDEVMAFFQAHPKQ